jgi:uncharacterized protein with LGFP repeats
LWNGGWTNGSSLPYQQTKQDPYDGTASNPNHRWTQTFSTSGLESRYGIGKLRRIVVNQRNGAGSWGGRVESVTLVGATGQRTITGPELRTALGAKSHWFTIRPTPIIRHWNSLGGSSGSHYGDPVAAEARVTGGIRQRFDRGAIYQHPDIGTRGVSGPLYTKYNQLNAHNGTLGFPITDVHNGKATPRSRVSRFQRGGIYYRIDTGAISVRGAIHTKYIRLGADGSAIGLPTREERSGQISGLRISEFERGAIYRHSRVGAQSVRGPLYEHYVRLGEETSRLGLPTSDPYRVSDGWRSDFENGYILMDRDRETSAHFR